jgi:teichuronic acid biosynthesis glycosyltransferase TuaH
MENVFSGRDIVIISQQPWDTEIGSNCKNIAVEFSKTNRVLYVNSPLDRISIFKNRNEVQIQKRLMIMKSKGKNLFNVYPNFWNLYPDCILESVNWIGNDRIFDWFNKINNRRFARSIKKAIEILGFKDVILFNDNEIFKGFYLKEFLEPSFTIYYSRDYMVAVDYWRKHGEVLEPKLIAKMDMCVANSTFLAEYCAHFNKNSFYVGQGCDLMVPIDVDIAPVELSALRRPIIGYVGALQSIRLDLATISYIAQSRPEWSIVLVGPEDTEFKNSDLHQQDNIHFLGSKPTNLLPYFINQFDVCINPQLVNPVTIGNYPRKIDEYLLFGKPTVATETQAMKFFNEFVYLATDPKHYIELIERAIEENSVALQEGRIGFARSHSWANSVTKIYEAFDSASKNL